MLVIFIETKINPKDTASQMIKPPSITSGEAFNLRRLLYCLNINLNSISGSLFVAR
ncbi:MAG: hypothetical protein EZS28_043701, partial [Streblomastix strix]